ncbi:branched-chain amino acid ABC transporter permease [Candidatus Entotheonella palauensis]|uniref:branched-chain amino acid ABC transporter permease n=1 Tax=Candidatus Entotheonella palauensis TaxID=93172 RepID=UPI000B7CB9C2|nr:branched-chain amino acid ABC transporter permease [Candidatus Entotheonella palauensis]
MQLLIDIVQNCLDGVMVGASYALLGLGFALIFGVLRRLNLAFGPVILVGVFTGSTVQSLWPQQPLLVFPVTVGMTMIAGMYVERLCFRAIRQDAILASMVSSFAIWMQLEELVLQSPWSQTYTYPFRPPFEMGALEIAPFFIRVDYLLMWGAAVVLMLVLYGFIYRTRFGRTMRAVAHNAHAARVLGLNVHRVGFQAFLLASAIGGCAGYFIAISQQQVTPYFGLWATIKGLIVMIIGGMGSLPGALVGGMILGVVEIQTDWFLGSQYRELVAYALLFAFLIVKPGGLFGAPGGEDWAANTERA